jgi:hypothetical protein
MDGLHSLTSWHVVHPNEFKITTMFQLYRICIVDNWVTCGMLAFIKFETTCPFNCIYKCGTCR